MNLYLITNMENQGGSLDYYDSIIVCEANKIEAKKIAEKYEIKNKYMEVIKIGEASRTIKKGMVLGSFNAA